MPGLGDLLPRHVRRQPRADLLWRYVGRNSRGVPGPAHRSILGPDPNLLAQLHVAEIHILIGQNDDHPLFDVDDDLLSGLDSRARPLFELVVIRFAPPDVGSARRARTVGFRSFRRTESSCSSTDTTPAPAWNPRSSCRTNCGTRPVAFRKWCIRRGPARSAGTTPPKACRARRPAPACSTTSIRRSAVRICCRASSFRCSWQAPIYHMMHGKVTAQFFSL